MDQSLEVTNIKNEPTDSTSNERLKIPIEMNMNSIKQESDCLVHSEIYVKTEPQEDESEFPVITGTSYEMCSSDYIKFEMEEPLLKIKCEYLENEIMQDPLNVDDEIKVEEHFSTDFDSEPKFKTEPGEGEKDEILLDTDKSDSHGSSINQGQDQLLIRNDPDHKDKNYTCNECNKIFEWKSHFDRHLRIHTGEKPFSCDTCNKSFNLKSTLNTHMRIHSGKKPHTCQVCKKVFTQKGNLNSHMRVHSGERPFPCHRCDKSFKTKHELVKHTRSHAGEKPFTCNFCDKAFTHRSSLNTHRRLHTGEKPYTCTICNKSFAQNGGLLYHTKTYKH